MRLRQLQEWRHLQEHPEVDMGVQDLLEEGHAVQNNVQSKKYHQA